MDKVYEQSRKEFCVVWFHYALSIFDKLDHINWYDAIQISAHPNITWDIVQQYPNIRWSYNWLSFNPNITWDIIQNNPDKPWNYDSLSANPNITWDIVQQHPDKPWNYFKLSANSSITWDIVQQHLDKPWKYAWLSINPNITWDIAQQHPDKPWNYVWLINQSKKQNITQQDIWYYDFVWNCYDLLRADKRDAWKNTFIRQKMQDHFRTSALKEELMQTIFHPKNIHKFKDWGFDE